MKGTLLKSLTAAMAIAMLSAYSYAQSAKRIDFAKEGCCLVWEEKMSPNAVKTFVFYAKRGQKLSLSLIDDTKQGSMDLGKISIEPNADPTEMPIEVSKDYTLIVSNNSSRSTSFRIMVNLEDAKSSSTESSAPSDEPERLRFPKGAEEMNYEKTVPANGSKHFVFGVKAGQEVGIMITPKNSGVRFVTLFAGKTVPTQKQFRMIVESTGDYFLEMSNPTGRAQPFTLDMTISAPINEPAESNGGEPIKFAAGETNKAITGRQIPANGSYDFLINARKGMKIGMHVSYGGATFSDIEAHLSEPDMQDTAMYMRAEERKSFVVKKTGDHRLRIVNTTGKKVTFGLYMDLE